MRVHIRNTGATAVFTNGAWDVGTVTAARLVVAGDQVVGSRGAAVADPAGGATMDAEARTAIAQILSALRQHGLIDT